MNIILYNIIKTFLIIILFVIIILLLRENIALKYEKRISRYSINPIKNNSKSLFERITNKYLTFVRKIGDYLDKNNMLEIISKRYEKYVTYGSDNKAIYYIVNKIIIGILFVFIVLISFTLKKRVISIYGIIIFFIIGFYILDIYLIYSKMHRKNMIKNQILRAIIIMNNAFKSGKSTLQAVEIASKELNYPLNLEFKKMYKDMKYGLSIETVFERFSKRIDIEEVNYISSSLTILNKTGGNIVKVFSSIEKTLLNKKRLNDELRSLTASSKVMVILLLTMPIIFIFIISLLSNNYFSILFTSPLGYLIIFMIILMSIIYAWLLIKIIRKVRV